MKVYIQTINKEIPDDWVFAAYLGFKKKGCDIKFFENINSVPFNNDNVVVAYIEDTIEFFKNNNISIPPPLNIPFNLNREEFLGRNIEITTMSKFREDGMYPIFVKPQGRVKEFSSGVLTNKDTKRLILHDVPDESLVMTSSVIDILSEYRCFVHNGILRGIKHYQGDFKIFPDIKFIEKIINVYKDAPISYTIDVGIIDLPYEHPDKRTVLIECSDCWSIGHYGLDIQIYSTMLRDRWYEIIRK